MRKTKVTEHLKAEEVKEKMLNSQSKEQFQRWQVVFMMLTGEYSVKDVANIVGVTTGTIHQWIHSYNTSGVKAMELQGRGGRRTSILSFEEESKLLQSIEKMANKGEIIIANKIKGIIENKIGEKVSKDYAYDLLHRHGWRKVSPRPYHPKSDKSQQENYKKNSRSLWLPPEKPSKKTTLGQ